MSEELTEFVIHNGEHSLYFSTTLDFSETLVSAMKGSHNVASKANTWFDWYIVPSSRPSIAQPTPKEERLDLPGANGDIDLTSILTGYPVFNNRTGTIEFTAMNTTRNWSDRYSKLASFLNGQKMYMILLDDPLWYYEGRFTINDWKSDPKWSKISVSYTLYPYKRALTRVDEDYLWDSLDFDDGVIIQQYFINQTIDTDGDITSVFPDVLGTGLLSGTIEINNEYKTAPEFVLMFLDWCETNSVTANKANWNLFLTELFGVRHLYPIANGYVDVLGYGSEATDEQIQENVDIIMTFVDAVADGTYTDDSSELTGWPKFLSDNNIDSTATKPDIEVDASDAIIALAFYGAHSGNPESYPQTQAGWNNWCRDTNKTSYLGMFPDANEDGIIDASDNSLIRSYYSAVQAGTYARNRSGWDSFREGSYSGDTAKYKFPNTKIDDSTVITGDDVTNIQTFIDNNAYLVKDEKSWWNFSEKLKIIDFTSIYNTYLSSHLRYEPVYISLFVRNASSKGIVFNFVNTNDGTDETATITNTNGFVDIQDWVVSVTGAPNESCMLIATSDDPGSSGNLPKFDVSFRLGVL